MAAISRRAVLNGVAVAGAAVHVAALSTGCTNGNRHVVVEPGKAGVSRNPFQFGAIGDGRNDDTGAFRAAYEAVLDQGGGTLEVPPGRFFIPGHLELELPGVSLIGLGGAVIGGGEVRVGPETYGGDANGVEFLGDSITGLTFDQDDPFGRARCVVVRNARGLDIERNLFRSAGKGVAAESSDGNSKFHSTAMLRVSNNRFAKLSVGIYGDTDSWDTLSDWHVTDNYFNYCADTAVWIASADGTVGGVDGLNFSGNTVFSLNHNAREDDQFIVKRYNLRLGRTDWLRIINNSFFEAGLSAVYLESPRNFTFVGNHFAWPGQRELGDAIEIHGGSPTGIIEGNTFANWTRSAVGLYGLDDFTHVEVGANAWNWSSDPSSWVGDGQLPGYRIYATEGGYGYPTIRDFQVTGAYDKIKGESWARARDAKSPKGGVAGAFHRSLFISSTSTIFRLSDIVSSPSFGGILTITVTNDLDENFIATYVLLLSSANSTCKLIDSVGFVDGEEPRHPSFTWELVGNALRATPVGSTRDAFSFDAVGIGALSAR